MSTPNPTRRLWVIVAVYCAGFAVLAGRLVQVQVIQPASPAERSADATLRRVMKPAHRGAVLDVNSVPLVMSEFAVTVRADPAKLGAFTPEVARLAAPYLGIPEAEVAARLLPSTYQQTITNRITNGSVVTWKVGTVERIRHNNGVSTNLPLERWTALETFFTTNRFQRERELAGIRTGLTNAAAVAKRQTPWWDLLGRRRVSQGYREKLAPVVAELALVRSNANECRVAGLFPEFVELRSYPLDHRGAHVLGYTTNSSEQPAAGSRLPTRLLGATGIEQRFDRELQGSHGMMEIRRAGGRELVPLRERDIAPTDGMNIILSLDANAQAIVEDALDFGMETLHPKSLSAVVVRPRTGEILAMANRPTWNPNTRRKPSLEALQNRAIMQPAEPGSTFKIVTYSAALDLGVVRLDDMIDCEGGRWAVPGIRRTINDDQSDRFHSVTAEFAFARSSNVGAVKLGLKMGTNAMLGYIRDFGFTARTGIECGEEAMATRLVNGVPKQVAIRGEFGGAITGWDGYKPSSLPFGYGLFATPLQTAMAAAAIANDGVLMQPRLVRRLETADGQVVRQFEPKVVRRVIKSETAKLMTQAMRRVVVDGTGKQAAIADFDVAGKTGTTKKVDPETHQYSAKHFYASFVGFFPSDDPEVCIMITADEPSAAGKGYYGGKACAPIFSRIGQELASYLALQPKARTNDTTASTFPGEKGPRIAGHP